MDYGKAFGGLSTCDLSDACDALGIDAATTGAIKAVYPDASAICGPVSTCRMSPTGNTDIRNGGDAIALHKAMKYDASMSEQLKDDSLTR